MEDKNKKCSYKEHKELNAIIYCQDCKIYMCKKCFENHSKFLDYHNSYKIDKHNQVIFTGYCEEKNHLVILKFYCKNHNKLCCASCLCKVKNNEYGQHTDCEVCLVNDIKEEKKNKLKENIKQLEDLSNNINESINKLKIIYEKMNEKKEELKLNVQKIFTKIRNILNDREDALLLEIDKKYESIYFKEELIKESEKLPNKIKISLEKGKAIDKEWDNDNKLNSIINDCINIENNIKNINIIKNSIKNFNDIKDINIIFYPDEENTINSLLENIKNFGQIRNKDNVFIDSKIIDNNNDYIKSLLNWINPNNKKIKTELLYRLSTHGEEFSKFHELCDKKGPTLTLFHVNDGNKVGIYTPLSWDKSSGWKGNDMETFIFNLNKNKKYKKIKQDYSIYCYINYGVYSIYFGNTSDGKTMKKIKLYSQEINSYYENGSDILQNNNDTKSYDLFEVEIFKISLENKY